MKNFTRVVYPGCRCWWWSVAFFFFLTGGLPAARSAPAGRPFIMWPALPGGHWVKRSAPPDGGGLEKPLFFRRPPSRLWSFPRRALHARPSPPGGYARLALRACAPGGSQGVRFGPAEKMRGGAKARTKASIIGGSISRLVGRVREGAKNGRSY